MKSLTLTFDIKPYSVNAYFYGNRAIKRREAREWEISIIEMLKSKKTQSEIEQFIETFDSKKHLITVNIICGYPEDKFFTKDGKMSSRVFDISNTEKPLIDVLFLKKYATSTIKNLGIDDKFISDMTSGKRPTKEGYKIIVKIQLDDLQSLEYI